MWARIWEAIKATLAVAALIAAALVSADKLDREKSAVQVGAGFVEPATTGAITAPR